MALLSYFEPQWVGSSIYNAPSEVGYVKAQNAVWRQGSILVQSSAAVTVPSGGLSTLAAAAGPVSNSGTFTTAGQTIVTSTVTSTGTNVVTLTAITLAGAQAASYWAELTFTAAGAESQTGPEFVVNCGPGIGFSVNVSTAGAPTGTTNYALYVGIVSQNEVLQQATKTTTATGATFSITAPLAFNKGILQAATNANSNIVGIAINTSDQYFVSGPGGATTVNNQSLFGATVSLPPTQPQELYLGYVAKLQNAYIEMSLINTQAWSPALIGSTFGLTVDASGFYVANPGGTACGVIIGGADGVPSIVGTAGDFGKRIVVQFNVGLI